MISKVKKFFLLDALTAITLFSLMTGNLLNNKINQKKHYISLLKQTYWDNLVYDALQKTKFSLVSNSDPSINLKSSQSFHKEKIIVFIDGKKEEIEMEITCTENNERIKENFYVSYPDSNLVSFDVKIRFKSISGKTLYTSEEFSILAYKKNFN